MGPFRRKKRGASAIEFALTLPLFLLFMFGTMEYGWYFFQHAQVIYATQDGCRAGAVARTGGRDWEGIKTYHRHYTARDQILRTLRGAGVISCNSPMGCKISVRGRDMGSKQPGMMMVCDVEVLAPPLIGFVPLPGGVMRAHAERVFEWQTGPIKKEYVWRYGRRF